jgi:hypothetical protein
MYSAVPTLQQVQGAAGSLPPPGSGSVAKRMGV